MSRPRRILGIVLALAAGSVQPAAASSACVAPGERVVARSTETVVTEERHVTGRDPLGAEDSESVWRACRRATGERIELERGHARWKDFRGIAGVRLAGPFVAYVLDESDAIGSDAYVMRRDLGAPEAVMLASSTPSTIEFRAVTLHRSGAAAWLRRTERRHDRLEASTPGGRTRVLQRVRDASRVRALHFDEHGVLHWRTGRRVHAARFANG